MDWQHSLGFNGGAVVTAAATQQQQQQQAAFPGCGGSAATAAAAAAAEPDPWCSGLDLMATNSAADEALPLLDLTDAGLDALLAPFEEWPCMLQPPAAGPPAAAAAAPALQPAAPAPRRKGGRPRIHHPRTPPAAAAGAAPAAVAPAGSSGTIDGSASGVQHYKQGGRGPKPKYVFATQEEAADARRERNRKAALESYYKKKERTAQLTSEVAALQAENAALQSLLLEMHTTGLCPLAEASQDGIDAWLKAAGCCAAAATAAAPAGADASNP
ncbi:hypothetical protein COHA_005730 [Chlorella ohadii]|uniref:BZIP domain-containing protein n=1 Tax=Chlorella ohadii TaxID=2649997 RepID=A0AAD5H5Z0_9CHLO|nr:hypothetical protein COHA_005730 [Chlorella ohadii]